LARGTKRRVLGIAIAVFIVLVVSSRPFRLAFTYPASITVSAGQPFQVDMGFPLVSVHSRDAASSESHPLVKVPTKLTMNTREPGQFYLEFRLFGLIPIRRVSLTVEKPLKVIPGGHSIGVVLRSSGLVITGLSPVETVDGSILWPAKNAGIEVGDVILSAGDQRVKVKEDLSLAVDRAGRSGQWVELLVEKPDSSVVRKVLWPVRHKDGGYRLGILVKDSLAGVGTLTFHQEGSGIYAALGHVISEGDSKKPVTMKEGHIVQATVTGVAPSRKGAPGEILGVFVEGQDVIGSIVKNGPCGISGILQKQLSNPYYPEPIPLAYQSQVKPGPAQVLTTINGTQIQMYSVEIEEVFLGTGVSSRGFTVKITDPRLLSVTGGIVQGMSGSPIIQDGCLVGAITHVLVNDPTRGYGTFAEWMAKEAHMIPEEAYSEVKAAFRNSPPSMEGSCLSCRNPIQ